MSTLGAQVISVLTMHEDLGSVAKPHKTGSGLGWDDGSPGSPIGRFRLVSVTYGSVKEPVSNIG